MSRREGPDGGWLEVSLAASIASFAVGMFFYDAFSFIQVTVTMLILVALSMALLQSEGAEARRAPFFLWTPGSGRRITTADPATGSEVSPRALA
jgi:hypothetical protein